MEQRLPDIQSYSLTKSVIGDYLKALTKLNKQFGVEEGKK